MQLVEDWGGFERLIAKLHETGTVTVQHDVTLVGKSGAPRQIDVLVTHTEGLYTHRILVECKHWSRPVQRTQIDAMITAVDDLSASKGVFFTTKGYQSGAETMAKANGIDIFVVREMTDEEWGAPGRVVDLMLHIVSRAIGNVAFPDAKLVVMDPRQVATAPRALHTRVVAGENGFESATPVQFGGKADTLERILDAASMQALEQMTTRSVTFNKRTDCTVHLMQHVEVPFEPPLIIPERPEMFVTCPRIECDVAIKIWQSRLTIDRSEKYLFALAIEDCVTGVVYAGTRVKEATTSSLQMLSRRDADKTDVLKNGSVMRVVMKQFFDFQDVASLTQIEPPPGLK